MRSAHILSISLFVLAACSSASSNDDTAPGGAEQATKGNAPPSSKETDPPPPGGGAPRCATDLTPWLAKLNVPGISAGIVKNGKLACTAVAGMANIEENRPVTPDTLFCIASVSKTITATAVMQAVDDGKLSLDTDVSSYLPFKVGVPGCSKSTVTLRELLTHTSSISDNPSLINCPGDCKYGDPLTGTIVTRGGDSPIPLSKLVPGYLEPGGAYYDAKANFLTSCPGTTASYSNMGIVLAGYVAEVALGAPLEKLTKDRIFTPLGMKETSWRISEIDPSHLAMPYDWTKAGGFKSFGQFGEADWPDGMLRTSVPELARFLAMFASHGEWGGKTILTKNTADEMRRVQVPSLDPDQGLVWFYEDFNDTVTHTLGHDGSDNGVSANMYFDPKDGSGVIVLSNGMWESTTTQSDEADNLMEALFTEARTR
jgi:CubicO group peptidase (beta-lactamase class C family)